MKQSEKSKITYDKILNAAISEFGQKGYDNATINNICFDNKISKGLIYHNFENKDQLYLCCVAECYKKITNYLTATEYEDEDFKNNIKKMMNMRYQFFSNNKYLSKIFFDTVLQSPEHLLAQIKHLRADFDDFNSLQYRKILHTVCLRDDITEEEAFEYFVAFQEMFNQYFAKHNFTNTDFNSLVYDHELKLSKLLEIMLYGIAKRDIKK